MFAVAVGCVRGIYGIGGGPILAPVLIGTERPAKDGTPAALASAFLTSMATLWPGLGRRPGEA